MIRVSTRRLLLLLLALAATFAVVRLFLHMSPNSDFNIGPYNVHHLFTGLLLITFCGIPLVVLQGDQRILDVATVGFGVGLSLALDEWIYLIVTDGSNASYLLPVSFWGGVAMVGMACLYLGAVWWAAAANTKTKGESK
jgi:hypothetical protein